MIEREQFQFANEKISSLKNVHTDYIQSVLESNQKVNDQIAAKASNLSKLIQIGCLREIITLLTAQWVDIEAENITH